MKTLYVAILHGSPRLDVHQVDLAFLGPAQYAAGSELWALSDRTFSGKPRTSISRSIEPEKRVAFPGGR